MSLDNLRKKVDKIDEQMLKLFNKRAQEVIKITKWKKQDKLETYSPEREVKILSNLIKLNKGPLSAEDVELIFREVLSVCRSLRKDLKIAYLGPQGTFTHLAAIKKFGKKTAYLPAETISEVFESVERRDADYGVVPVENSTEGAVSYTLDMFFTSNLKICSEITINISHALLTLGDKKTQDIKRIYSNPQVFAQCRKWISRHLSSIELIPVSSTAKAALDAKADSAGACIGNKILAQVYGLEVIASSIEDFSSNVTRFLVIAQQDSPPCGQDKTSILFSIKDKVGALYDFLASFKKSGINLTKIESRPSKKKAWDYYFFVDFEGHRNSPKTQKALKTLEQGSIFMKILGSYPKES